MDFTDQLKSDLLKSWTYGNQEDVSEEEKDGVLLRQKEFLFLCAVTKLKGSIDIYKKSISLTYEFDAKKEAIEVANYLKKFTDGDVFFLFDGAKREDTFKLQIKGEYANGLLRDMSLSHFEGDEFICDDGINFMRSTLADGSFLWYFKGVLYATAKLQFPDENYSNYSLQMTFSDSAYCKEIAKILEGLDLIAHVSERKSNVILQSRNGGDIADILALGGANDSVLELNAIIARRDAENDFNRQSNFYMANYRKTVIGAKKYIEAIEKLERNGTLRYADAKLKMIAKARKENNDASMQELAQILGISKTSLSRYLNKLLAMAEED